MICHLKPRPYKHMPNIFLLLGFVLFGLDGIAQSTHGDFIIGDWVNSSNEIKVHCYKENGKYYARTLWIENQEAPGTSLPPEEQHWINMVVMKDFEFDNEEWANGTIYQPKTDKTYTAFIQMPDYNTLTVTGFVFFRWLCESETFHRVAK